MFHICCRDKFGVLQYENMSWQVYNQSQHANFIVYVYAEQRAFKKEWWKLSWRLRAIFSPLNLLAQETQDKMAFQLVDA